MFLLSDIFQKFANALHIGTAAGLLWTNIAGFWTVSANQTLNSYQYGIVQTDGPLSLLQYLLYWV